MSESDQLAIVSKFTVVRIRPTSFFYRFVVLICALLMTQILGTSPSFPIPTSSYLGAGLPSAWRLYYSRSVRLKTEVEVRMLVLAILQ